MAESNNNKNSEEKHESFFEIMDGIMIQMSKTKKVFLVMVLTILILPPIALLIMTATFENPFGLDKIVEKIRKVENIISTDSMPVLYGQGGSIDD